MKIVELKKIENSTRIGDRCSAFEPNITEDSLFIENNEVIGFYIRELPEKARKLVEIANIEFRSDRVPKSLLERSDTILLATIGGMKRSEARKLTTVQMSSIIGSIPPKPHFKRNYATKSSVHSVASASVFIKAMALLCKEAEKIVKELMPEQYDRQKKLIEQIDEKWRFGNLFTSSISNYNISAPFHIDKANLVGCSNVIITKRHSAKGGNLHIPDYGVTIDSADNSMLFYPAWRNVHGVTPIEPLNENGYRNSLIFYPLKSFVGLDGETE